MGSQDERATILIVDDECGPRESLRILLKPVHDVLTATSASEALEVLRGSAVDLVSVDLNMPGIKGGELMRAIRAEFPDVEIIVITGHGTLESATEALRCGAADYLQKPFDVVQVNASVTRALVRQAARRRLRSFLDGLGNLVGADSHVRQLLPALDASLRLPVVDGLLPGPRRAGAGDSLRTVELLELLAETIEARDGFLRGHARRTAYYAGLLADRLSLSPREQHLVRIAAFFHDIGKIGVPGDLLVRPGRLAASERQQLRGHAELGARLVEPLGFAPEVAAAIRHHHESWDGSGYPDGLRRDDIPLAARIVRVADAFDALSSPRPHRPALPPEAVLGELRDGAGRQFDPDLVKEFLRLLEDRSDGIDLTFLADVAAAAPSSESSRPSMPTWGGRR